MILSRGLGLGHIPQRPDCYPKETVGRTPSMRKGSMEHVSVIRDVGDLHQRQSFTRRGPRGTRMGLYEKIGFTEVSLRGNTPPGNRFLTESIETPPGERRD